MGWETGILMDLLREIADANWTKTTYIKPHEYVLRSDYPQLVEAIVTRIKEEGYIKKFFSKRYRYVNIDGYKYWYIPPVLNRQLLELDNAG